MGNLIHERFNSISELMNALETRKNNDVMKNQRSSQETWDSIWSGTKDWNEAVKLIRNGWTEKIPEIKKGFSEGVKVNIAEQKKRNRPTTGIVGYAACVPNAILGLPNSMISTERVAQKAKTITLIYSATAPSRWKSRKLIECGITMLKIVNKIELSGVRVKLIVEGLGSIAGSEIAQCFITLKDWRQPIDLAKIAFPIAHPSMLRRIMFKWLETVPELKEKGFTNGYGTPASFSYDYETLVKMYKEKYKVIGNDEYFITAKMVDDENHDVEKIMARAGINGGK